MISVNGGMDMVFQLLLLLHILGKAASAVNLVVVVVTQNNAHHISLAKHLQKDVQTQADQLDMERPAFYLTHKDFADVRGAWTYLPLIERLSESQLQNNSWVLFCEEHTKIYLKKLYILLSQYDSEKEMWIGCALKDREPTIIHHFSSALDLKYPHHGVGFAMSAALVTSLANRMQKSGVPHVDFSIDPSYELAQYVSASKKRLTHSPQFCIKESVSCATLFLPSKPCDVPVPIEGLSFAVKTCHKFHGDRVPVVKSTWAPETGNRIEFYSDLLDPTIPTVNLGVPNTSRGHCGKTTAILRHTAAHKDFQWLIIADDDTLLSVPRLQTFLSCYSASEPTGIGERYGYNINSYRGYPYITGGGGIILSRPAVQLLAEKCRCPEDSTPDDMYLGMCMAGLNISLIHSSRFHQARPEDYATGLLAVPPPISFHKFWNTDPLATHRELLSDFQTTLHSEL